MPQTFPTRPTPNPGARAEPLSDFSPRFRQAVELIGRRWSGALLRTLLSGDRRFNDLLSVVPGLSDRLLSQRLRELEEARIVVRSVEPGPPVRVSYALSAAGRELEPTLRSLSQWAERWLANRAG
jgi:DNA-binding HxlR family transcriptional regulator